MTLCLELVEKNSTACKISGAAVGEVAKPWPLWLVLLALAGIGYTIGYGAVYMSDEGDGYGS